MLTIPVRSILAAAALAVLLSACQSSQTAEPGTEMATTAQQLNAEAYAFGVTQGAIGIASAFDPTGMASVPVGVGSAVAYQTWMASADARLKAAQEADDQAFYKHYGLNPDGTPSGTPGPGSAK